MLNTTPQNLSRILKNLETEMDVDLFFRTTKGVDLSPEGERFLEFAKKTIYQLDNMQAEIQFQKSNTTTAQEVTLYSNNVLNEMILNDILVQFYHAHPAVKVTNILVDWKEGYDLLSNHPSALGFLYYLPEVNQLEDSIITPTLTAHSVAIMAKNHPLVTKDGLPLDVNALFNYKLVILTQNDFSNTEVFYHFNNHPILKSDAIINSGHLKFCYQLTASTDYICVGSLESFLRQDEALRENLVAIPLYNVLDSTYALIAPKELPQHSPQNLLYTFILHYLQNNHLPH